MRTLYALPLSLLLCALPAQDKSPFRFVPADANFVVRISSPAKWQQQFAKAQITKLFQSQTLAPMVGMLQEGYGQMIEQLRGQGTIDADLIDALVTTYTGDIVIAAKVDLSNLEEIMQTGEQPEFEVVMSLSPDGSFDLAKIAAEIEKAADKNPPSRGKVRELSVGNLKTRILEQDDGPNMSLPTLVDGHLVVFLGSKLEPQINRAMAATGHYTGGNATASMFVHAELGSLMKAMTTAMGAAMDMQGAPFDVAEMVRTLGLESVQNFDMSLAADGEHMQLDYEIGLAGELGLLGAMVADQPSLKLLRAVPDDVENFGLMTLDTKVLFATIAKAWKVMGDEAPMSWDDAMAAATEATKVRLKEDVIDHLGAQVLMLNPTSKDGAEDEAEGNPIQMALQTMPVMAIELKNGKAFAESLETMLRSAGLHAARKTEEYQGQKVYKLSVGGMAQVEYAVTDDMLLLSVRNDEVGARALRSALDASKSAEGEMPARIKSLVAGMPEGWSGLSVMSMSETFKGVAKAMQMQAQMGAEELPPQAEMMFDMLQSLGEEMKRLGIDRAVGTTHTSKNGMRMRMRM
jgi:hypothetical protein